MWLTFKGFSCLGILLASHMDNTDASLLRGAGERDLQAADYPEYRYTTWHRLDATARNAAQTALGYDETSWNVPGTNPSEAMRWKGLTPAQTTGANVIGFVGKEAEDVWDCYQNHYNDYDWAELVQNDLHRHFIALGWTEPAWSGLVLPPLSDNIDWVNLTPQQQTAARGLCYFRETWDRTNMLDWTDEPELYYPDYRYTEWSLLGTMAKDAAQTALGYNESSWNVPGTNLVEDLRWSDLTQLQKSGANDIGFVDPDVWDCYQNHYNSYHWAELVQRSLHYHFVALGWSQPAWNGLTLAPSSDTVDWVNLTPQQQSAVRKLCYFQETWDRVSIVNWDDTTSAAATATPPVVTTMNAGFFVGIP